MTRIGRMILSASLILGVVNAPVMAQTLIPVTEDTWIDGLASTAPHGSELAVAICPVANYWIYVKFDVGSLVGTVETAELRLTRFSGDRPEEISVYLITDDGWSEATLTGVNRPAPTDPPDSAALAAGQLAAGYDRWTSAALVDAVRQEAQGDGVLTLMLRENPAPMFDVRYYRSREAGVPDAQKPMLAVTVGLPEVVGLALSGSTPTSLTWNPVGAGVRYDVAGGRISELHLDGGTGGAQCLADDVTANNWSDPRPDPLPGDGDYYLVRVQAGTMSGSWGFGPDGEERTAPLACP